MKKIRKKILTLFLLMSFLSIGTNANAFSFSHKNSKPKKPTREESVLNETFNSSVVKEEYKSGERVIKPNSDEEEAKIKAEGPVIEGSVQKNVELSLEECIKIALGNNPEIRASMNEAIASHARINQAWSEYFPQLQFKTGLERERALLESRHQESENFTSYLMGDISASQLIYDFGVVQNEVTIKKIAYEKSKVNLTSVVNNIVYSVKDDYFNLLLAIAKEQVAQDTVNKYQMFYNQAKAFYEIGTNPKIDVTIAEVNLSNAKLELIASKNNVESAIATLNDAMGVPEIGRYQVKDKLQYAPLKITFDDAFALAKQSRPDLKAADLEVQQSHQEVKLAKKSYFPTLEGEAGYRRGGYEWNGSYGFNYGVYLKFPVVNGMLVANQISEAKANYNKVIAEAESTEHAVHLEVHDAYLKLDVKQRQIPVSTLQVKQAKENYDLAFGRYRVGVGDPIELKDAENAYQQARITYYQTLYDYNSAKAALEKAIGRNIVTSKYDKIDLKTDDSVKNQIDNNKKFMPKEVKKPLKLPLIGKKKAAPVQNVSTKHPETKPLVPVKKETPAVSKKPTKASTKANATKKVASKAKPSQKVVKLGKPTTTKNEAKPTGLKPVSYVRKAPTKTVAKTVAKPVAHTTTTQKLTKLKVNVPKIKA